MSRSHRSMPEPNPPPDDGRAVACSVHDHVTYRCTCWVGRHRPCAEHDGQHCELCEHDWPCEEGRRDG